MLLSTPVVLCDNPGSPLPRLCTVMGVLTNPGASRKLVRLPLRSARRLRIPSLFLLGSVYLILVLSRRQSLPDDVLRQPHPVADRLRLARQRWNAKVRRQSRNWPAFQMEYARRYHLSPPPGLRAWFDVAQASSHILVDEYDSVMRDLGSLRSFGPYELTRRTLELANLPHVSLLNVRAHPSPMPHLRKHSDAGLKRCG